jgi:TonB family protein
MNRLQKKCLIFTAGFHLLLLLILLVGPGFFKDKSLTDDLPVLTEIPSKAVEAVLSSGVKAAAAPVAPPTVTPPTVTPPPPERTVTPPTPAPAPAPQPTPPAPSMVKKIEEIFTPEPKPEPALTPDETKPVTKPVKPKEPHKVQISLTEVHKIIKPSTSETSDADADAKEQKRLRKEHAREAARAVAEATRAIKDNASTSTVVDMPGNSSVAYANYGQIVKSIYDRAWIAPETAANDDADTLVKVEISRDGTVLSADIVNPSGDSAVDNTVQRALDKVRFVEAFPDDSTDKTRIYKIHFNLKAKRMNG